MKGSINRFEEMKMQFVEVNQSKKVIFSYLLLALFLLLLTLQVQANTLPSLSKAQTNRVLKTDFQRGLAKEGRFFIYLENNNVTVDVVRQGQQLLINFPSTFIAESMLYIKDVADFETQVEKVESFSTDNKTYFILTMEGEYAFRYKQLDRLFVIDIFESQSGHNKALEDNPISLNFQDIPIRSVLQLIADEKQLNLVTSDSVIGNITLRLDEVPWEQALDIVLKVKGLAKVREGNVLMVAPITELIANENDYRVTPEKKSEDFLYTEFIQINYAKAADIATMLASESTYLLSEKGNVSIDARTNILLIRDTAEVVKSIKKVIKVLDVPVRQVIIEARMVTVNDSVGEKLGIQWGLSGSTGNVATSGTLAGIGSGVAGDISNRLSVNLPIIAAAGNLAFQVGKFASGNILDLQLSALEQENKAEIIATPRITTLNQQTAYIEQGTEIPYVESSSSGATSVSFKKAVLSLEVTPQITPDNHIILELVITQDSKGDTVSTSTGDAIAINTQEIATKVLVENGETLVLGGIYQQQVINSTSKIPLLGDIPFLGFLFRSTSHENSKAELLIFVTPRIVIQKKY